ncbi:MAG: DUF6291 domain-containing protein [Victivallaceae bacterium]|nr:DUF6291 domain-containing protein [Victivallaceae bacterium]
MARKSFLLYCDTAAAVNVMSDTDAGTLFKAIFAYNTGGQIPTLSPIATPLFAMFCAQFDRDADKWEDTRKKRIEAGRLGGKQKLANASKRKQNLANLAVSVSDSVSVNQKESILTDTKETPPAFSLNAPNAEKSGKARFTKPTIKDVIEYCHERGNTVNPQAFIDHYEANGWKIGQNPMKDWRAAIRTWERNNIAGDNPQKAQGCAL